MATVDFTRIASNIAALNSLNALQNVNNKLGMHQARLASGKRLNEAMDDPAGLTMAIKLLRRSEGISQAIGNISSAKNLLAVAEGGLGKIQDLLGKMRVKAEQAANDTLGTAERTAIAGDLSQFAQEIDDIITTTTWNDNRLLDTTVGTFEFQTSSEAAAYSTWSQSTDHAVDGGSLSGLATVAAVSTAVENTDANAILNAQTAGNAAFSGLTELESGTYTVRFVTSGEAIADDSIQLLTSTGTLVTIDADGTDGGLLGDTLTFNYTEATGDTLDLGNGLEITLEAGLDAGLGVGTYEATVDYTADGSYSVALADAAAARAYMTTVDTAITTVSSSMANIGAVMARFTMKEEVMAVASINTEAAFNRIMNADMAFEQLEATKFTILQQTATAMLAQANASPQNVLQLFR